MAYNIPSIVSTTNSGNDTATSTWNISYPAYSIKDLIIFNLVSDAGVTHSWPATGPNGETVVDIVDSYGSSNQRISAFYFIASENHAAGTFTVTPSSTEQWTASVIRILAGHFDADIPIDSSGTGGNPSSNSGNVPSPTWVCTKADGLVVVWLGVDQDPILTTPSGWTNTASVDRGNVSGTLSYRTAPTTLGQTIASANWTIVSDSSATLGYVINGRQTVDYSDSITLPLISNKLYNGNATYYASNSYPLYSYQALLPGKLYLDSIILPNNLSYQNNINIDYYKNINFSTTLGSTYINKVDYILSVLFNNYFDESIRLEKENNVILIFNNILSIEELVDYQKNAILSLDLHNNIDLLLERIIDLDFTLPIYFVSDLYFFIYFGGASIIFSNILNNDQSALVEYNKTLNLNATFDVEVLPHIDYIGTINYNLYSNIITINAVDTNSQIQLNQQYNINNINTYDTNSEISLINTYNIDVSAIFGSLYFEGEINNENILDIVFEAVAMIEKNNLQWNSKEFTLEWKATKRKFEWTAVKISNNWKKYRKN